MSYLLTSLGEEETTALGERLGALLFGASVVLLDGDLGAGKTRFAQGVARGLGLTGTVTSPTFNLVLEYPLPCVTGDGEADTLLPSACVFQNLEASAKPRGLIRYANCHARAPGPEATHAEGKSVSASPSPVTHSPSLLRHFDLYRLEQPEQLDDLDYFALIEEPDAVSLVEWGSKFASQLPLDYIQVHLLVDEANPDKRLLELSAKGPRCEELLKRFALAEGLQANEQGG